MPSVKTEPLVLSSLYNKSMQTVLEWTILKTKQEREKKKNKPRPFLHKTSDSILHFTFFLVSE